MRRRFRELLDSNELHQYMAGSTCTCTTYRRRRAITGVPTDLSEWWCVMSRPSVQCALVDCCAGSRPEYYCWEGSNAHWPTVQMFGSSLPIQPDRVAMPIRISRSVVDGKYENDNNKSNNNANVLYLVVRLERMLSN